MKPSEQTGVLRSVKQAEDGTLIWVVHPAGSRPKRFMLVVLVLAGVAVAVYLISGFFWVIFSLALLVIALRQFFLPTTFYLTDEAVGSRFLWFEQKREWACFRSYFSDRNGILLSPFPRPSRLENFRGFYLIGANRVPEAVEFITRKLK